MPEALKAVIVDVDGTLYRQGPVRRYVAAQMLRFGIFHPLGAWKAARAVAAYRRAQEELRESGEPDGARMQTREAARQTGYSENFISRNVDHWMDSVPLPSLQKARRPGLVPFLDWAHAEGIRLGVVSDYEAGGKLRALGIEGYFPVVVSARDEEVGVFKPNPLGLLVAVQRLGVKPREALYVGDRMEVDGVAAVAAGIPGALISAPSPMSLPGIVTVKNWFQLRSLVQERTHAGYASVQENHSF